MKKLFALLSFSCFLFACHPQKDQNNFADLIKGDWVGPDESKENSHNETKFISFDDSTCRISFGGGALKYEIEKDTFYIESPDGDPISNMAKYTIAKLTTDSLVLLPTMSWQDTFHFSKIHPKNIITPTTIYFTSPNISFEIDSSRNVRIYGELEMDTLGVMYISKGGFSGRISENEYNSIISKIRNIQVDSLQQGYEAEWSNDQTLGVAFAHGNTATMSAAYGHHKEPIELHLLFGKLMNVYKEMNKQPDSSVTEINPIGSNLIQMTHRVPVPPPPLPPLCPNKKFTPPAHK
ncbi:hypothetical protein A3860_04735 [Niastella vici]|uniref:DUF6438 domain-containing protein n=1 Tax=Niastella vici TaxID=1703345 RepID=A0A1V9FRL7_9BACT|nr:DUF6438 domain-containing protein [Niastella vici]OQP61029.1 hypothetical protein A3860_04735 [Niastella vici]